MAESKPGDAFGKDLETTFVVPNSVPGMSVSPRGSLKLCAVLSVDFGESLSLLEKN